MVVDIDKETGEVAKFEGNVEARPVEPGVPVLIVAPGETAHDAEEANHHKYQQEFFESADSGDSH